MWGGSLYMFLDRYFSMMFGVYRGVVLYGLIDIITVFM